MFSEINAGVEALKTFYRGYKWMEQFGQRMAESSSKEETLTFRENLQEMLKRY